MDEADIKLKPNIAGARRLARKLLKDAKITRVPVSLYQVISFLKPQYNLDVLRFDFGDKISGILVAEDDQATIGFNSTQAWVRRRFTIAHEIGHLLLGHTCEGQDRSSNKETEANCFAAELLAPTQISQRGLCPPARPNGSVQSVYRQSRDIMPPPDGM